MQLYTSFTKKKFHFKKTKPHKVCKNHKKEETSFIRTTGVISSLVMAVILMPVILLSELDSMLDNMCVNSKREAIKS